MLNQAAATALRMLLFRAGPQDFPFAEGLTRVLASLAVLAAFLQFRLTLPATQALVHALATIAALAGFTLLLLQARGLANRHPQTLNSLFATDIFFTPLMLGPVAAMAPHLLRIAENPEAAQDASVPAGPALLWIVLASWNFLVSAHIYRHALNTHFGVGALVAMLAAIVTVSFASAVSALVS